MKPRAVLLILTLAICVAVGPSAAQTSSPAGTYRLQICRTSCGLGDSADAYIRGIVVLAEGPGNAGGDPDRDSREAGSNGCFWLTRIHQQDDSYAGLLRYGNILWRSPSPTSVAFAIYGSPDAGYELVLTLAGVDLVGQGDSWGAGVAEIHAPSDTVIAKRLGPPDRSRCKGPT